MVTGDHGNPGQLALRHVVMALKPETDYVTTRSLWMEELEMQLIVLPMQRIRIFHLTVVYKNNKTSDRVMICPVQVSSITCIIS